MIFVSSFKEGSSALSEVAVQFALSTLHLRRVYKRTTGQTLHGFIEETRVSCARSMLAEQNLSLKEILYRLGFSHPSAFSSPSNAPPVKQQMTTGCVFPYKSREFNNASLEPDDI